VSWVGKWKNQHGSILEITSDTRGMIAGTYHTKVGKGGPKATVRGIHSGDMIALTVSWAPDSESITAWTGLRRGKSLHTLWHLVSSTTWDAKGKGAPAVRRNVEPWEAFNTNADLFKLV
jgi:hypothetical protein